MTFTNFTKANNVYKHLEPESPSSPKMVLKNPAKSEHYHNREPRTSASTINGLNRGRVAIFIDGVNLFHAALQLGIEIDYLKLLCRLTSGSRLLRAFFYTIVDVNRPTPARPRANDKQQGFLFWMRRNGYRVVTKEAQPTDNSKKPNLNVEIAVDMITLAPYYDTAILVSGDGALAYAVEAVTSKGGRVEVVSLRPMTSDSLIDVADYFLDLDSIKQEIQKDSHLGYNYRSLSNSHL
ncbi:NYN domain-containing protein [Nostoc sp. FACHB-87]|uniref:LabA-like NYN domain-containing protein n=1 Tax=Nostocales TaxID=1161 RepID=UPI00168759F0|nr:MULTISPECIES: NYN domain-containing protein [Nostocales]MBD2298682.1 NYN domain-containing protein [Nostoc sp. FACHB-190]MBD2454454.1 NYN domain-containing protein [Nostoc sp. FACHB-87]MBD2474360.1 NYN domain-containing protein [Anabaena sp. FACHB-83]MBD2487091.1 NYN domain-containing protein [Aulosira sp. FACHB-615]